MILSQLRKLQNKFGVKMNQMQNKNNAGLRFSKKTVWRCILGVIIVLFGVFVYRLNQVDKTELWFALDRPLKKQK